MNNSYPDLPGFVHPAGWPAYVATVRDTSGGIHASLTFYYPADADHNQLVARVLSIWSPARDNSGLAVASLEIARRNAERLAA